MGSSIDLIMDGSSSPSSTQPLFNLYNDSVHHTIMLGPICSRAVYTAPVQRLQRLKQLGPTHFGRFCSAQHTRFEHSLGVAHIARQCAQHLAMTGAEDVSDLDIELISLAGLCHDLGHGPFSHSFDAFLDQLPGQHTWHHEQMSCNLLELTLTRANIDLSTQEVRHVQDMIDNGPHRQLRQYLPPCATWRLQIVSNATNGLDADKCDYLPRDVLMTGVQQDCSQFSPLLTQHCKVLGGQIVFDQQQQLQLAKLYDMRAYMHESVYQDPQGKAAEVMLADAMQLAEPQLNISSRVEDAEEFLQLDDSVLYELQHAATQKGAKAGVIEGAALLKRLQHPDSMYKLAAEAELPLEEPVQGALTADEVVRHQAPCGMVCLKPGDIRLHHYSINYGFGAKDPLERVLLFDPHTGDITTKASTGIDRKIAFLRRRVRVYVTKLCIGEERRAYVEAARTAFSKALQARYGAQAQLLCRHSRAPAVVPEAALQSAVQSLLQQPQRRSGLLAELGGGGVRSNGVKGLY